MIHHSTDTFIYLPLSEISLEPSFVPLDTPNSGHNCVTVQTGWIKVTRYNFYTFWEYTKNTNIRCRMETVQWEGQTEHVVLKQLSGIRTEHGRFLWLWHLSEICLNVCIVYTNVYNTKQKCSDNTTCFKIWITTDTKKLQLTSSSAFISGNVIATALFCCSCCVSVASRFILSISLPSWKQYIIYCSETGILHLWGDNFECTWNVGN